MTEIDHAWALLEMATKDFKALSAMKSKRAFSDEIFGFHAQQAVEKALKAWLAALEIQYPKTHDLSLLLALLEKSKQKLGKLWSLVEYNAFAVQYRYEAFSSNEDPLDRSHAIREIKKLLSTVKTNIKRTK